MIILSNHDRSNEDSLADKMKRTAHDNNTLRLYQLKEQFKKLVKNASVNGLTTMEFVLAEKTDFHFLTESLIQDFYKYIVDNGFKVSYDYVTEDGKPSFYLFNVDWS